MCFLYRHEGDIRDCPGVQHQDGMHCDNNDMARHILMRTINPSADYTKLAFHKKPAFQQVCLLCKDRRGSVRQLGAASAMSPTNERADFDWQVPRTVSSEPGPIRAPQVPVTYTSPRTGVPLYNELEVNTGRPNPWEAFGGNRSVAVPQPSTWSARGSVSSSTGVAQAPIGSERSSLNPQTAVQGQYPPGAQGRTPRSGSTGRGSGRWGTGY